MRAKFSWIIAKYVGNNFIEISLHCESYFLANMDLAAYGSG